jgi:hypothetical protein
LADSERKLIHDQSASKRSESDAADFERAWAYTTAQIRGAVRAGQLEERVVFDAASGDAQTTAGAVAIVAGKLTTGSRVFSLPRNNGRPICACISDACDDMDPDRVRRYVEGGFSLGQLDADAHSRVVYGKCRGTYLRNERALQRKFVLKTGGLAGIGLARAAQSDRSLDPNKRSTYATFSGRSKLDEATSKAGVLLANGVFKAENYWVGAIALVPAPDAAQVWSSAMVWVADGKVTRIMLNVADQSKLGELPKTLEAEYGKPSASAGTVTSWQLPNGLSARLDAGAAMSLVVEAGSGVPPADGGAAQQPDR